MNFSRLRTKYFTRNVYSQATSDGVGTRDAVIEQSFNTPLIDNAQEWVIAVERFEIALNGIPFFDGDDVGGASDFTMDNYAVLTGANRGTWTFNFKAYSLRDFIYKANVVFSDLTRCVAWGDAGALPNPSLRLSLSGDGFISIEDTNLNDYNIQWSPKINAILGFNVTNRGGGGTWTSEFPRWDTADRIDHIRITSNLGITSDNVGQSHTNILTDIAPFQTYSNSCPNGLVSPAHTTETYSYSPRQKIIYVPQERRYLNVLFPSSIIQIRVAAEYVYWDHATGTEVSTVVQLPQGTAFAIKLGFYSRQ